MAPCRRKLLTTAATASFAAVAGCVDGLGGGAGDRPEHARWVPAEGAGGAGGGTAYAYLQLDALSEVGDGTPAPSDDGPSGGTPAPGLGAAPTDPLVATPTTALDLFGRSFGMRFAGYGFAGGLFGTSPGGSGSGRESTDVGTSESILATGGAVVAAGSFDLAAVEEAAEGFERAGTHRGARVYEGTETDDGDGSSLLGPAGTDGLAFGAREDALVFGRPPSPDASAGNGVTRARVERALDVEAGDEARLADRSDGAAWALDEAARGVLVFGRWGERRRGLGPLPGTDGEPQPAALEPADGTVSSLSLPGPELTATLAAAYPDGEVPDREAVESAFGTTADERDVTVEGTRVSVTGTWNVGS